MKVITLRICPCYGALRAEGNHAFSRSVKYLGAHGWFAHHMGPTLPFAESFARAVLLPLCARQVSQPSWLVQQHLLPLAFVE